MDLISLLATVSEQASTASPLFDVEEAKLSLYELISDLHWLYAMLLLSVGVVYLLYGWRIFRALVVISFGFVGLFIVTSIFFIAIYGLQIHGPYSQLNPIKWLANVSAVALIVGSLLMIRSRAQFARTLEPLERSGQLFWEYLNYGLALVGLVLVWFWRRWARRSEQLRYQSILAEV